MIVNVTGSSFLWPLNTIYIHDHLGKSLSVAGVVLMLNAAAFKGKIGVRHRPWTNLIFVHSMRTEKYASLSLCFFLFI
jgi:hypothetical protein